MGKKEKIRLTIQPHETKEGWMNRCKRNTIVRKRAKDMATRSPYDAEWIALNICETKWKVKNPVATYGPPESRPPSKRLKGTIFSYPNQRRH